jgi:hypothetical protein
LDFKSSYMFLHVVLKCDLLEKPNNQTGPILARLNNASYALHNAGSRRQKRLV